MIPAPPRLSIVVPTLNEAEGIGPALAALAPLRRAGHEVIVVDGGSADGTPERARPHADRVLGAPRGRAVQMNAGAAVASGAVLLFLHADTGLPADADAAIAHALATGRRWGRFDVAIAGRSPLLRVVAVAMNLRSRLTGIATGDQGMFVERTLFTSVGGFPSQPLMEDVALSRTLKKAGGRPACVAGPATTSGRRWERYGILRTIVTMWSLRFAYWRGADPADLARRYDPGDRTAPRKMPPTLIVFAKEPVPGRVKTRLAATIGAGAAAAVYQELAEATLSIAAAARDAGIVGRVRLCCDPDAERSTFRAWRDRFGIELGVQRGGDLGERMRTALRDALAEGTPALLVGTDCPGLDRDCLAQAAAALASHDAVFVPAEDGGYVLVGCTRDVDAFSGVPWSTPAVMAETRNRLRALGARWHELSPLWDLDTDADLARWQAQRRPLPSAPVAAP